MISCMGDGHCARRKEMCWRKTTWYYLTQRKRGLQMKCNKVQCSVLKTSPSTAYVSEAVAEVGEIWS